MTSQTLTDLEDVSEALRQPFPQQALKSRSQAGRNFTYVEGHTVIHRLNDATGNCWDFAVKDIDTSVAGRDKDGNDILLVRAHVAMTIPGLGTREHIGVQAVRANAGEDLVKGAVTDALKKAATLFGVGLELYGPDYEAGETQQMNRVTSMPQRPPQRDSGASRPQAGPGDATDKQLAAIAAMSRKIGVSIDTQGMSRQDASNTIESLQEQMRQPEAMA